MLTLHFLARNKIEHKGIQIRNQTHRGDDVIADEQGKGVAIARPWDNRCDHRSHIGRIGNVAETQCPAAALRKGHLHIFRRNIVLRLREKVRIRVLLCADFLAQIGIVSTLRVDANRVGAVVKLPNHSALVQR